MTALLAIIWLIGTIAGIYFIIKPAPRYAVVGTRGRAALFTLAIFVGLPLLTALLGLENPKTPERPVASNGNTASTSDAVAATSDSDNSSVTTNSSASAAPQTQWAYDEKRDSMRGTTTKYAQTESQESFENSLGTGEEKTVLEIQKHTNRYDVAISNSNLQFTCNNILSTHVSVKFDAGPIQKMRCTDAVGDKFGVAFISAGDRFVDQLRKARRVTIEAEVFQRGDIQMSFDVTGFNL